MAKKIACVVASCLQNLLALAAITLLGRQYFAMMVGKQIYEFKNGDTKIENCRSYVAIELSEAYPSTHSIMVPSKLMRRYILVYC